MRKVPVLLTVVSLTGALLLARPAVSFADYTVSGVVVDCNGAGVPNAWVNVVRRANMASDCDSPGNSLAHVVQTNSTGHFSYVQVASGYAYPDWCWSVYVVTPPIPGESASDIVCCGGLPPTGGHTGMTVSDDTTGTLGVLITITYSGDCTQGGDPGEGERLPH